MGDTEDLILKDKSIDKPVVSQDNRGMHGHVDRSFGRDSRDVTGDSSGGSGNSNGSVTRRRSVSSSHHRESSTSSHARPISSSSRTLQRSSSFSNSQNNNNNSQNNNNNNNDRQHRASPSSSASTGNNDNSMYAQAIAPAPFPEHLRRLLRRNNGPEASSSSAAANGGEGGGGGGREGGDKKSDIQAHVQQLLGKFKQISTSSSSSYFDIRSQRDGSDDIIIDGETNIDDGYKGSEKVRKGGVGGQNGRRQVENDDVMPRKDDTMAVAMPPLSTWDRLHADGVNGRQTSGEKGRTKAASSLVSTKTDTSPPTSSHAHSSQTPNSSHTIHVHHHQTISPTPTLSPSPEARRSLSAPMVTRPKRFCDDPKLAAALSLPTSSSSSARSPTASSTAARAATAATVLISPSQQRLRSPTKALTHRLHLRSTSPVSVVSSCETSNAFRRDLAEGITPGLRQDHQHMEKNAMNNLRSSWKSPRVMGRPGECVCAFTNVFVTNICECL